jgi:CRP/FNR family transcriptional regulator, cyclic AMP receptor protein
MTHGGRKMNFKTLWGNPFKKFISDPESDITFLSTVPVFESLSKRQVVKIHSLMHVRTFDSDEIIFRKGDPGVGLYVIRDGAVDVYSEFSDLTRYKVASLESGDFFGEISLLNDSPRSATVVAVKSSILLGFFRHDLLELMNSDPSLGVKLVYNLAKIVAERLRIMNESLEV